MFARIENCFFFVEIEFVKFFFSKGFFFVLGSSFSLKTITEKKLEFFIALNYGQNLALTVKTRFKLMYLRIKQMRNSQK